MREDPVVFELDKDVFEVPKLLTKISTLVHNGLTAGRSAIKTKVRVRYATSCTSSHGIVTDSPLVWNGDSD